MAFLASKILMVRPAAFGYNPQTAESNAFQKEVDMTHEEIQSKALVEFDRMVNGLRESGIQVLTFDDKNEPFTPDAIFPNNWFSTHSGGTLCLYPMEADARRNERDPEIISAIEKEINAKRKLDISHSEKDGKFLEGTGSLILDHENRIAYASLSSRTNPTVLDTWALLMKFETVVFSAVGSDGKAIYHTNVMMCLGDKFAVICLDSIANDGERSLVSSRLEATGREVVDISYEQMGEFAGNMLLLRNNKDEKILVMSKRAHQSLNADQIAKLESHAKIASFDIETIEDCGGGSVRCMIAEIF